MALGERFSLRTKLYLSKDIHLLLQLPLDRLHRLHVPSLATKRTQKKGALCAELWIKRGEGSAC